MLNAMNFSPVKEIEPSDSTFWAQDDNDTQRIQAIFEDVM